eukprot:Clim_evm29s214 gene=Clim_evmTU29s214
MLGLYRTSVSVGQRAVGLRALVASPRFYASAAGAVKNADDKELLDVERVRNIGISAHIDSGKTTLTERVLFYTGRISKIHEVRGKDGVGAKMDSMELEREKGITIQSAATYTKWRDYNINIIDTPGHVDFTIEVERSLRVLDGAVMVLCSVGGVQSQTMTVDRQMKRYNVPAIGFINKLDRMGANPLRVVEQIKSKLRRNAAAVMLPIGRETHLKGLIDLIEMRALHFEGDYGENVTVQEIPEDMLAEAKEHRHEMIGALANVDEKMEEYYLMDEEPPLDELKAAIRRQVIAREFMPVFMGTALKNVGVQPMLDAVVDYLPNPLEVENLAIDQSASTDDNLVKVALDGNRGSDKGFVGLAFKLEESKYGQLTYLRVYQGKIKRGDMLMNTNRKQKVRISRLVRMHADEMEDVQSLDAGELGAIFGLDCFSGDTFTADLPLSCENIFVPDPVISLSIKPNSTDDRDKMFKGITRFQKEDPTFRMHIDPDSKETIISGMGELHLQIYTERLKREYGAECVVGKPRVAFKETLNRAVPVDYVHKKQSGGAGQYAKIQGELVPLAPERSGELEFVNELVGNNIPPNYVPAIEKGWMEACQKSYLTGQPITGVAMVLKDGAAHAVDSSELAFNLATRGAVRDAFKKENVQMLEPIMSVEISAPEEFQGTLISQVNQRRGIIKETASQDGFVVVYSDIPLAQMFGYSTDLRSSTQGKGEFAMEYSHHAPAPQDVLQDAIKQHMEDQGRQEPAATGKKK